tara:strand:- start:879 stop:1085 length:207 start_codon:yes stop_codon:yes gene_type:complete
MKYYLTQAGVKFIKEATADPKDIEEKHKKYRKQAAKIMAAREAGKPHPLDPGQHIDLSKAAKDAEEDK